MILAYATWRGETVVIIRVSGEKALIARKGIGLRTVKRSELEAVCEP